MRAYRRSSPRFDSALAWSTAGLLAVATIIVACAWNLSYRDPVAFRHDSSGLTTPNTSGLAQRAVPRSPLRSRVRTADPVLPERWFRVDRLLLQDGRFCWDVETGAFPATVAHKQIAGWWRQPITRRLPVTWTYGIGPRVDGWRFIGFEIARAPAGAQDVHGGPGGWDSLAYVPLWAPFLLFLILSLYLARRGWVWHSRWGAGLCMGCGYDLRGTPDRCPECGRSTGDDEATARQARPRSRWSLVPAAAFAILLAFVGSLWAYTERRPIVHSIIDQGPEVDPIKSHNYSTNTDVIYVSRQFHREDWGIWKGRAYVFCFDTKTQMKQGADMRKFARPESGLGAGHPDQWDYRIAGIDSGWSVLGFQLTRGGDEPFSHRPRKWSIFVPLWFPIVTLSILETNCLLRRRRYCGSECCKSQRRCP